MPSPRRIVIVRLKPRIPSPLFFQALLNASDKAATVALSGGSLTATGSATNSTVRADIGLTIGDWFWETQTTTAVGSRGGMARSGASLTAGLGTDALSIGGPSATGAVLFNGASKASGLGTITTSDTIGHWWQTSTGTYSVRKNNGAWFEIYSGAQFVGQPWYPALQVGNGGVQVMRTDPATFLHPVPPGARAGLYHDIAFTATDVYVSSDPYVQDAPLLLARLSGGKSEIVVERHAKIWPWNIPGTDRRGRLVVLNGDRALDAWGEYGWRDAEYQILAGNEGDDFGDFVTWSAGVVDSFGWDDRWNIVLDLADPLARLEVPLQPSLYPVGSLNAQIIGKPEPVAIGLVRVFPTLESTQVSGGTEYTYQVHDAPVTNISSVYDRGDVLTPVTDWNMTADAEGFKLVNPPDNPVSALVLGAAEDVSVAVPRSGVDSDFVTSVWAGGPPTAPVGWTNASSAGGVVNDVATGARFLATTAVSEVSALDVTLPGSGDRYWRVDVTLAAWTLGTVRLVSDSILGGTATYTPTGAGLIRMFVNAVSTLRVWEVSSKGNIHDFIVSSVVVTEVEAITHLPAWLRYLCVTRRGLTLADIDVAAAEDLDEKAPYALGWFGNSPIMILKLLRMALDTFTGWVTSTRAGVITVGRLEADQSAPIAFALNTTNVKTIRQRDDIGENFTRSMAGERNYAEHAVSDFATAVTPADRAEFTAEWGAIREAGQLDTPADAIPSGASLTDDEESNEEYRHAIGNDPQATLSTDGDDVRFEINRVSGILGAQTLRWWDVTAALESAVADSIEIGQRVTLTMPIEELDAGVSAIILGAAVFINSNDVRLTLLEYPEAS